MASLKRTSSHPLIENNRGRDIAHRLLARNVAIVERDAWCPPVRTSATNAAAPDMSV
jgi:hypothetical protein